MLLCHIVCSVRREHARKKEREEEPCRLLAWFWLPNVDTIIKARMVASLHDKVQVCGSGSNRIAKSEKKDSA